MIVEKIGDIIEFNDAKYICHQCNCVSTGDAGGLAKVLFEKFPHADTYKRRDSNNPKTRSEPGTIEIMGDGSELKRHVINMYAQYYPGAPKYDTDSSEKREEWMKQCLAKIYNMGDEVESIAFPKLIGCGIARGNWDHYYEFIKKYSAYRPKVKVYIVEKQ
jgi:hypothetical protein